MKPIDTTKLTNASLELTTISSSFKVLHFDDFPILFLGVNKFGNKILGSHLEEDDDSKTILTLHTILSNKEYYDFINKKKSYKEILQETSTKFLVEKSFGGKALAAYNLEFEDIPEEYQPLENSYCPNYKKSFSFSYSLGLKGKVADLNRAIADQVSNIQTAFSDFLENRLKSLKNFNLQPAAYLQPYTPGSFKINLELEYKQVKAQDLFSKTLPFDEYVHEYLKYITTSIVADQEQLLKEDDFALSDEFKNLLVTFEKIYEEGHVKLPDNPVKELKEDLKKSLPKFEEITEQIGKSFDSIEFSNYKGEDEEFISIVDANYSEAFQNTVDEIEATKKVVTVDNDYKDYQIYIYHLNTDTRQGNAFIKNIDDETQMSKPKIKISGDEHIEQTKYTESLHLNKWIKVKAKAKRIDSKFKFLDILYEE
ncbi:MAG: hypothetical protein ACRCSM_11095 [Sediminibacterium sp.]|jgi:hypothetical protein|nr:hypothetical protein [Chitinophagaceae bacterium]MCA6445571.1 hypothetical protein [Chitinophagaceae bacterium]